MDPAGLDGGGGGRGGSPGGEDRSHSRWPFRTFTRGARHSGSSCHFAQHRKASPVCRYFQRGFCHYEDWCSYQHPQPLGRRHSEPLATQPGPLLGLARRGSEPTYLPSVAVGWSGAEAEAEAVWDTEPGLEGLASQNEELGVSSWTFLLTSPDGGHGYSQKSPPQSDPVQELWVQLQSMDLEREQDSRNVVCGICMDKVWDKPEGQRIFGILPNCPHAHCLGCLRTWRKSHQHFPLDVIKACPQCRVYSSYIIPHKFWVSEGAEKEQLIRDFRARTSQIRCRYFARGADRCPFKSDCIYLHQLPGEAPSSAPPAPARPSRSPPGPDCTQPAPRSEMVLGPTALHPTYPTALHPTALHPTAVYPSALHPSALHPSALHPTVLYPSALLEDQMFLDYNLATAFLGLESYWIAPVLNGRIL